MRPGSDYNFLFYWQLGVNCFKGTISFRMLFDTYFLANQQYLTSVTSKVIRDTQLQLDSILSHKVKHALSWTKSTYFNLQTSLIGFYPLSYRTENIIIAFYKNNTCSNPTLATSKLLGDTKLQLDDILIIRWSVLWVGLNPHIYN